MEKGDCVKREGCLLITIIIFALSLFCLVGCRCEQTADRKIKDLDYTICDEGRLPDALVQLIQEKKKNPFKLTYNTKDYLYIVIGYGAQNRGDLCIQLKELYLTENAIFVDTQLDAKEQIPLEDDQLTYPWIAVKCELYDVQVIFE